MLIHGDYGANGFAHIERLIVPEIAEAFLRRAKVDIEAGGPLARFATVAPVTKKTSFDVYVADYPPMEQLLWGLTPTVCNLTGRDLLPTYNYFRIYRRGDICRVHADRPACEHSISLTLGYSDGLVWPFEVGQGERACAGRIEDDFDEEPFASIAMAPGDAVLYRGVERRHGRLAPNPNAWSAHMFLHWVDRNGPHADAAFDGRRDDAPLSFV